MENVSAFYKFTGTINHLFLTNQNARSILVILIKSNIPSNRWYIARIQLFRERLSEKLHAVIPIGIVGGFDFIVLERNLKEWYERPWRCVCECWVHCSWKKFERMAREAMDMCLRVLKESNKRSFDSYSVRNSVLIISHITFRGCCGEFFSDNLSQNSCIPNMVSPCWLRRISQGDWRQSETAKYFEWTIYRINLYVQVRNELIKQTLQLINCAFWIIFQICYFQIWQTLSPYRYQSDICTPAPRSP